MWTMDTGRGQPANLDDEEWYEWAMKMLSKGVILNGLIPNATSISAIMNELFRAFKSGLRISTHQHYTKKIKANAKAITRLKFYIAEKFSSGAAVSEAERTKAKATYIFSLNPGNLGPILFGKLSSDGYAAPDAPIFKAFTKDKILEAHQKVCRVKCVVFHSVISSSHSFLILFLQLGFDPVIKEILKSKKLRHKVGQGKETDQTRRMRNLEKKYNSLKENCNDRGISPTQCYFK